MKMLKSNFRMINLCYRGSKSWVICNFINIIINPLRNLTVDVLLVGTIYNYIGQGKSFESLIPLFIALILFYIVNIIFENILYAKIEPNGTVRIQRYIDEMLCKNAAEVDLSMFDNAKFYEENIFSVENCTDIAKQAVDNMGCFIAFTLGGLFSVGLITNIEPLMSVFIVISILLSILISNSKKKIELKYNESKTKVQTRESFIHRVFYERDYAKELRSYPDLVKMNLNLFNDAEDENMKLTKSSGKKNFIWSLVSVINSRVIMYWAVMFTTVLLIWFRGEIEPGNLVIMTLSVATAALLINAVTGTIPQMANIKRYSEKFDDFLSYSEKRKNSMGKVKIEEIKSVEFKNVSFTYPEEKETVLKNISFTAKKGEHLVIVGLNGSGKSTIMKLLMGFYKPDSGNIYINGIDINDLDTDNYLKLISCVMQEIILYALSVEENITATESKADKIKINEIAKSVCLDNVLDEATLNKCMTKEFNENGVVLSGGMMQKLALARALYKDASLLILDETTSAIDTETETQITETIERLTENRIIVQISHKLSCVKNGSRILYLENGEITEEGSHNELINRKGKYYELFLYQAEKFDADLRKNELIREVW